MTCPPENDRYSDVARLVTFGWSLELCALMCQKGENQSDYIEDSG